MVLLIQRLSLSLMLMFSGSALAQIDPQSAHPLKQEISIISAVNQNQTTSAPRPHCLYPNTHFSPMTSELYDHLLRFGRPEFSSPQDKTAMPYDEGDIREIFYRGYISYFNTKSKTAYLTIHRLLNKHPSGPAEKTSKRRNFFKTERRLSFAEQVTHEDYHDQSAVFSRGHCTPNGDCESPKLRADTFSTANIAPQVQASFNDGLWNNLEICTRIWRDQDFDLTVYTGTLFQNDSFQYRLDSGVAIPSHFYKIIVYENEKTIEMIPFLMENRHYTPKEMYIDYYLSSLEEIERISGIRLFPSLPPTKRLKVIHTAAEIWPGCESITSFVK